jgi:hypothetical protein
MPARQAGSSTKKNREDVGEPNTHQGMPACPPAERRISLSYINGFDGSSCVENGLKAIKNFETAKALAEFLGDIKSQWKSAFMLATISKNTGVFFEIVHRYMPIY